jgi:hypothetical protein
MILNAFCSHKLLVWSRCKIFVLKPRVIVRIENEPEADNFYFSSIKGVSLKNE